MSRRYDSVTVFCSSQSTGSTNWLFVSSLVCLGPALSSVTLACIMPARHSAWVIRAEESAFLSTRIRRWLNIVWCLSQNTKKGGVVSDNYFYPIDAALKLMLGPTHALCIT